MVFSLHSPDGRLVDLHGCCGVHRDNLLLSGHRGVCRGDILLGGHHGVYRWVGRRRVCRGIVVPGGRLGIREGGIAVGRFVVIAGVLLIEESLFVVVAVLVFAIVVAILAFAIIVAVLVITITVLVVAITGGKDQCTGPLHRKYITRKWTVYHACAHPVHHKYFQNFPCWFPHDVPSQETASTFTVFQVM